MSIPIYQVDAFTDRAFAGNPAGVCLLQQPAEEGWMQSVAAEINLSETAFPVRRADGDFDLRWFTPAVEVELCGHATLATSHVLFSTGILEAHEVARYHTRSGLLEARLVDGMIELDFPANPSEACDTPDGLLEALGLDRAAYVGRSRFDLLVEAESAKVVRKLSPDSAALLGVNVRGVIATAVSDNSEFDFVSRFFCPHVGVAEDPVTGSAHCTLTPYWSEKLDKKAMLAYQASQRGGVVRCTLAGDRVKLAGNAITVLQGELVA